MIIGCNERQFRVSYCLPPRSPDCVWDTVRAEAQRDADEEPLLRSFLHASILGHGTFEASLSFILANRLASPTLLSTDRKSVV